ncbi:MAG: hypothetical protein ABI367_08675 [Mucilaginibacter sp.]
MKKLYYLLAFVVAAATFTACNPLDKTYKQLGDLPTPQAPPAPVVNIGAVTLTAADYATLPSADYAKTLFGYKTSADAAASIPAILAVKYPNATYNDKSSALVTYGVFNPNVVPADTTFANVNYTVINPTDYVAAQAVTGTTFKDYSDAQVLLFLNYKYPTPVANQLSVLTYLYFLSGVTPSSGVLTTDSFLYLNGVWTKIYTVSAAQYAAAGHGNFNQFVNGDGQAAVNGYLASFLKNDAKVAATAKFGDVKYVSYNYYNSTAKITSQRVQTLTYDGTNWIYAPIASTPLQFLKTNGVWVADNTVNYTLTTADMKGIGTAQPNVASTAATGNLAQYGNYNIQSGATAWTDDQIAASIAVFLKGKFTTAVLNQKFVITYSAYNGSNITAKKTFNFDGTNFVLVP